MVLLSLSHFYLPLFQDSSFHELPAEAYTTESWMEPNDTTSVVSHLKIQITAGDDGNTYRCVANSAMSGATDMSPFVQKTLTVSCKSHQRNKCIDNTQWAQNLG